MPECYIRGSTIKYLRIPDEVSGNWLAARTHAHTDTNVVSVSICVCVTNILTLVVFLFALCLMLLTWSITDVACHSSGTFFIVIHTPWCRKNTVLCAQSRAQGKNCVQLLCIGLSSFVERDVTRSNSVLSTSWFSAISIFLARVVNFVRSWKIGNVWN